MPIVSFNASSWTPQADQTISAVFHFLDHLGVDHVKVYDSIPAGTDQTVWGQSESFKVQNDLAAQEQQAAIDLAASGGSPDLIALQFADKNTTLKAIIRDLLARTPDLGWLNAVDFLANVTSAQLQAQLGIGPVAAAAILAKITQIRNARDILKAYNPPVSG